LNNPVARLSHGRTTLSRVQKSARVDHPEPRHSGRGAHSRRARDLHRVCPRCRMSALRPTATEIDAGTAATCHNRP
jgi:hypothetical protein